MNILILSAGTRNKIVEYFVNTLNGTGKVIATDMSNLAPAIYEADKYYIVPKMTSPDYVDTIIGICKKEKIDGVLSLIDPELSLLAIVKAKIIPKDQTYVLAGAGVDLEHFYYIEYPEETNLTKFLFIGRIMREKGIDELFSAMERLNNEGYKCSLDVLGGFEENYSEKIQKYEEDGWLNYQGYQSDIRPFIAEDHCFVLPSWHEGMANTNLECAASGRPIITSNIHGCLEAVIEGKTGFLVKVKNADDLYETMKKFMELSYEEKRAMGIAGREHMANIFDKKKVVEETISYLKNE